MRTVRDTGWPYEYRAFVVKHDGWFRKGWRAVIERRWVQWDHHKTLLRVFKTKAEAWDAANRWLDQHDNAVVEADREYVEGRASSSHAGPEA